MKKEIETLRAKVGEIMTIKGRIDCVVGFTIGKDAECWFYKLIQIEDNGDVMIVEAKSNSDLKLTINEVVKVDVKIKSQEYGIYQGDIIKLYKNAVEIAGKNIIRKVKIWKK